MIREVIDEKDGIRVVFQAVNKRSGTKILFRRKAA